MDGAAEHRRCGGDGVWLPQAETAIPLPGPKKSKYTLDHSLQDRLLGVSLGVIQEFTGFYPWKCDCRVLCMPVVLIFAPTYVEQ